MVNKYSADRHDTILMEGTVNRWVLWSQFLHTLQDFKFVKFNLGKVFDQEIGEITENLPRFGNILWNWPNIFKEAIGDGFSAQV